SGRSLPVALPPGHDNLVARQILDAEGVPSGNIYMVAGKVDTDPLFPDDPYMSPNRRVTITLMREEPPLPDNLTP
ncbi:MAG: hypothetical protein WAO13_08075, partial [Pseudolabrys sp.]